MYPNNPVCNYYSPCSYGQYYGYGTGYGSYHDGWGYHCSPCCTTVPYGITDYYRRY